MGGENLLLAKGFLPPLSKKLSFLIIEPLTKVDGE